MRHHPCLHAFDWHLNSLLYVNNRHHLQPTRPPSHDHLPFAVKIWLGRRGSTAFSPSRLGRGRLQFAHSKRCQTNVKRGAAAVIVCRLAVCPSALRTLIRRHHCTEPSCRGRAQGFDHDDTMHRVHADCMRAQASVICSNVTACSVVGCGLCSPQRWKHDAQAGNQSMHGRVAGAPARARYGTQLFAPPTKVVCSAGLRGARASKTQRWPGRCTLPRCQ